MADNGSMAPPSRPQREGTPIPSEPPSSQAHPGQISDFTPPNRSRIKSKDDIFDDEDFEDHAGSHRSSSTYRRAGEIGTNNEVEADDEMTEGVDFGNNGSASEYPEEESNEIELPRSPAAVELDDTQSLALSHDNEHFEENGSPRSAQQLDGHSSDRESRQQDRNELNGDRDNDDAPFDSNFDWNDLYGRFNAEMQQKHREEEELRVQYMQLMDLYKAWQSAGPEQEHDRASKRLCTRIEHVQRSEASLRQISDHRDKVFDAFTNAMNLLG